MERDGGGVGRVGIGEDQRLAERQAAAVGDLGREVAGDGPVFIGIAEGGDDEGVAGLGLEGADVALAGSYPRKAARVDRQRLRDIAVVVEVEGVGRFRERICY